MARLTNIELVRFARSKIGTPYIYGAKQTRGKETKLTTAQFYQLQNAYGKSCVWDSDIKKVGKICCDCSGLISWYTGKVYGSAQFKNMAKVVNPISTIKNAPIGVAVWMKGHIGIYTGIKNGVPYYVAEDGSAYGCREVPLSYNKFTHWFKIDGIKYINENIKIDDDIKKEVDDEVVTQTSININGKNYDFNRILKNNKNYIELTDFKQAGFDVGYNEDTKVPSFGVSIDKKIMNINNKDKEISAIMKNNENYVRLRDLEDILNIDFIDNKVIITKK